MTHLLSIRQLSTDLKDLYYLFVVSLKEKEIIFCKTVPASRELSMF